VKKDLVFFNTLSGKKERFKPLKPQEVGFYSCGPTIYDYAHIGNLRAYLFEDLLHRVLKWAGYQVNQVMNLTDVDDKTIEGARKEDVPLARFTHRYAESFFEDMKTLRITPAAKYPRATEYISQMTQLIEALIQKGLAYIGDDGSVYYRTSQFQNYGKLSKKDLKANIAGARVSQDEYDKEQMQDFALWKKQKDEKEPAWDSPWGKGRPGWHIECSAMSMDLLGEHFDIHTGGEDNIFPHHENEIAQSEGATGRRFVNYWLHCRFLLVDGEKMSKSKNNFYTLRDLTLKGHDPLALRYLLMTHHYRHPVNFTFQGLRSAEEAMRRLNDFWTRVEEYEPTQKTGENKIFKQFHVEFQKGLSDDLNISQAMAGLFECVMEANKQMDAEALSLESKKHVQNLLEEADSILDVVRPEKLSLPEEIQQLVDARQEARKKSEFEEADRLRKLIGEKGYTLEDKSDGVRVKKK